MWSGSTRRRVDERGSHNLKADGDFYGAVRGDAALYVVDTAGHN
jgi:hypothetical protein